MVDAKSRFHTLTVRQPNFSVGHRAVCKLVLDTGSTGVSKFLAGSVYRSSRTELDQVFVCALEPVLFAGNQAGKL